MSNFTPTPHKCNDVHTIMSNRSAKCERRSNFHATGSVWMKKMHANMYITLKQSNLTSCLNCSQHKLLLPQLSTSSPHQVVLQCCEQELAQYGAPTQMHALYHTLHSIIISRISDKEKKRRVAKQ